MTPTDNLESAKSIARTASKCEKSVTVSIYQTGASAFVVSYESEGAPSRGLLIGQYRSGMAAAPVDH